MGGYSITSSREVGGSRRHDAFQFVVHFYQTGYNQVAGHDWEDIVCSGTQTPTDPTKKVLASSLRIRHSGTVAHHPDATGYHVTAGPVFYVFHPKKRNPVDGPDARVPLVSVLKIFTFQISS